MPENHDSLHDLREAVRGAVQLPGEPAFADVSRPWNTAVAQDVLAVVEAADAEDVAALLRFARAHGLKVAVQPSGHGATGTAAGTILLRTTRLDGITVDPAARTARVGAGVRSGALTAAAAEHGLVHLPGSSPVVSVAGYTLGGGLGWLARRYGLAAEHLLAIEAVDASGRLVTASAEENSELFFALAGGGGDYAVVTALTLRLHRETELFGGSLVWPVERAAEVLAAFREVTARAPRELTTWLSLVELPGGAPIVVVAAAFLGPEETARELLKPFDALGGELADSRKPMPFTAIGTITNDPTSPVPSVSRAELLRELDEDAVAALLAGPIAPLLAVQVRHLGGALADPAFTRQGPHGALTEEYAVYLLGGAPTAEAAAAVAAKQAELAAALGGSVTGRKPVTFLNAEESLADAFGPEVLARLRAAKQAWDPEATVTANFPVPR